ncbi:MAG TPA: DUF3488 and transglutaminase-like domain-containing protein [Micromonosporaceae bacterium]|nr:DUF3488 and transglutaminase-like domain-containing protein [Micromonosporaceae bacterium]
MSSRLKMGLVAAAATLLSAAPMSAIFDAWTWLFQSIIVVALVAGAAALARSLRAPVWAQLLSMVSALLITLAWMFPSGGELLFLPAPATFAYFGQLISSAVPDMRTYAVPVPDTDPLLFISVLGVGVVMVIVDLLTVVLRRPALAGLPMLAIYSVPVAVYTDRVPPAPFVIGAAGFLWLLVADHVDRVRRFGRRFTEDGRDVDVWEPSPLAASGRRLAVVGIAVAVLLPLAVPGMAGGLLDRFSGMNGQGDGRGGGSGPGRVNLFASLSGQLRQSETRELVRVTTNERDPFYLRFGVAEEIGTDGFAARNPGGQPVTRGLPFGGDSSAAGMPREQFRAEVEITSDFTMPLLPVYAEPVRVSNLGSGWLYDPWQQVIFSYREQSKDKKYSFDYVRWRYTPEMLDNAPTLAANHPVRQQFTAVPQVREVEELVARLTRDKQGDYQRVRAIYDYFSRDNGFTYSLRTEGGTSGQDIVNFLVNKTGFCQQYAAAMAWLVRAAGVPARVAFGFTNGTNPRGNTYTLTNLNLHAWTEVYFSGIGWVPFDPTPAANVPGSIRSDWAPNTDAPDPVDSAAPSADVPDANPTAGPQRRDRHEEGSDPGATGSAGPSALRTPSWPWWTLAGLIVLSALLALPALRRVALRRRRHANAQAAAVALAPSPAAPGMAEVVPGDQGAARSRAHVHAAWDELIDTLIDFGVPVVPSETPRATVERLVTAKLTSDAAVDALQVLGRAEERARYARGLLPGGRLSEALLVVRQSLVATADRRTRMRASLLPPSVLLRWRLRIGEVSARLLIGFGRLRDGLLRWSPRRLLAGRPGR